MATNPDLLMATTSAPVPMPPVAVGGNPFMNTDAIGGAPAPAPMSMHNYIPAGFAQRLLSIAQHPAFQRMLQSPGFQNQLARFGVDPAALSGGTYDPSQMYTRQMARADMQAGNPVLPPGMIPAGYTPPMMPQHGFDGGAGHGGAGQPHAPNEPIGMVRPPQMAHPNPQMPTQAGFAAPQPGQPVAPGARY